MRLFPALTVCVAVVLISGSPVAAFDTVAGADDSSYQLSAREWQGAVATHDAARASGDPMAPGQRYRKFSDWNG